MSLTIGSLCTGYGGLDMAVESVLDARTAWVSDIDKGACKVLAHRYPDVPNIGDMTAVDWTQVEPVDVITGGTPCQDLSHAGKRAGMTEGTRSNLWVAMREAIATIRPSLVIWENVAGAYSAGADSELESNPRLLADTRRRDGEPVLRALGRVLGDLASLGYVGGWHGLRAADVGAPHGRLRVFVVAVAGAAAGGWRGGGVLRTDGAWGDQGSVGAVDRQPLLPTPDAYGADRGGPQDPDKRRAGGHAVTLQDAVHGLSLLPTPRATDGTKGGPNQRGSSGDLMLPSAVAQLLPTPAVNDMGAAYTPDEWDAWTERMKAEHGNGNGHGKSLSIEAQRLLPTPLVGSTSPAAHGQISGQYREQMAQALANWGQYAAAIARWENLTRPAPAPTEPGPKGNPRLSPAFTEWMMGVPAGWITDVPGITRNEALKLCGNGVVPQQAAAAIRSLLGVIGSQERAA